MANPSKIIYDAMLGSLATVPNTDAEGLTFNAPIISNVVPVSPATGQMWMGNTLNIKVEGGTLQVGEENYLNVINKTGSIIPDGTFIYTSGVDSGYPKAVLAQANTLMAHNTLAITTNEIAINAVSNTTTLGLVHDLNTNVDSEGHTVTAGDEIWLSATVAGGWTNVEPYAPSYSVSLGNVTVKDATVGEILVNIQTNNARDLAIVNKDPTGFDNPANVVISYDETTQEVTISGSNWKAYWRGKEVIELSSPITPIAHDNVLGHTYFLYWDGTGINGGFNWSTDAFPGFDKVLIAYVYYRTGVIFCNRECHGLMDWRAHQEFHETAGSYLYSGGQLTAGTYVLNPTAATHTTAQNTYGTEIAVIKDEDLPTSIPAWIEGTYTTGYRSGAAGDWIFSTVATVPYHVSGGNIIQYNQNTGVTWQLTDVPEDNYYNTYVFYVPVSSDANSQKYRELVIPGQQISTTLAGALTQSTLNLDVGNLRNIFLESFPYIRLTWLRNSSGTGSYPAGVVGRCAIVNITYNSGSSKSLILASGLTPGDHGTLTGRTNPDSHPTAAISTVITNFDGILSATDLDVQLALDTLDNYSHDASFKVISQAAPTKILNVSVSGNTAGATTTIATAQTTSKTYTIPDANMSEFVMSESNSTINGVKTFGTVPTLPVQNANKAFMGPISGTDAVPAFRPLVTGDIPSSDNLANIWGDCEAALATPQARDALDNTTARTDTWAYPTGGNAPEVDTINELFGAQSVKKTISGTADFFETRLFTVPKGYLGKALNISFLINTSTMTLTTEYIIKVNRYNSAGEWKETITVQGSNFLGIGTWNGFFIAGNTVTDLYSIVISATAATATTPTIVVDSFYIGQKSLAVGAAITDWIPFVPTGSWTTNTTYAGWKKQVSDSIGYQVKISLAGGPTAAALLINLPAGDVIDITKIDADTTNYALGACWILCAGVEYKGEVGYYSSTQVQIVWITQPALGLGNSTVNATAPGIFTTNDEVHLNFSVPIVGKSSGVTMLNSDRVKSVVRYASSSGQDFASGVTEIVQFDTKVYDTKSEVITGAAWKFTAKTSGYYRVEVKVTFNTGGTAWAVDSSCLMSLYKNTSTQVSILARKNGLVGDYLNDVSGQDTIYLNAGEFIHVEINQFAGTKTLAPNVLYNFIEIEQLTDRDALAALPISSANVVGRTDAVAPSAGMLGETISSSSAALFTQATPSSGVWNDDTDLSLPLQPGIYRLDFSGTVLGICSSSNSGYSVISLAIRSGTTTLVKSASGLFALGRLSDALYPMPGVAYGYCNINIPRIIVTTATTFKISIMQTLSGVSTTIDNLYIRGDSNSSLKSLIATRIA